MEEIIFYLCDRQGHCRPEWPPWCMNDECFYTSDVNHAKNGPVTDDDLNTRFKRVTQDGVITYWEIKE